MRVLKPFLIIGLVVLATLLFDLMLTASYEAGCAGDTKGGAVGNIDLALGLEGAAFDYSLSLSVAIAALISIIIKLRWRYLVILMTFMFLATQIGLFFVGNYVQTKGLISCHF